MLIWKEQNHDAVRTLAQLQERLSLNPDDLSALDDVLHLFQMKITPYYLNLIDPNDPDDPLRKMAVPDVRELHIKEGEMDDPIGDTNHALHNHPEKAITHRYPDRVLLHVTPQCGGYCRFCFRRRIVGRKECCPKPEELQKALDYIQRNNTIHEVILTGGDPFTLEDAQILSILNSIKKIGHIRTIRIHTRMPAWNPFRLTDDLVQILREARPLWLVTHFNHAREVTETAVQHLSKCLDAGIPILNQSVLLKGINDTLEAQQDLGWALIRPGIKPYYLHHVDLAKGISHFRVEIEDGLKLLKTMRGKMPGYAIPHYMFDIPGGYGKVPLEYQYLQKTREGHTVAETPFGGRIDLDEDSGGTGG